MTENKELTKKRIIATLLSLHNIVTGEYIHDYGSDIDYSLLTKFNNVIREAAKSFANEIALPDVSLPYGNPFSKDRSGVTQETFLSSIYSFIEYFAPEELGKLSDYKTLRAKFQKKSQNSLPSEILDMPKALDKITGMDEVIVKFIEEAIAAYGSNCILSAAFMLGVASERAILLLIDCYGNSITDPTNQQRFKERTSKNKTITAKWEEFKQSYKSCKSKPTDPVLSQDLDTLLGRMFDFYRITRNSVGHPEIIPDLVDIVVLANIGNFVQYVDRIFRLKEHFEKNGVEV